MNTGAAGPAGREGQPGPAGREGDPGKAGREGARGPEGIEGHEGPKGREGPEGPPGPVGAIVDLTTAQEKLAEAVIRLSMDVRRLTRWVALSLVAAAIGAGILVVLLIGVGRLKDIAAGNKINTDILVDCTTPTPAPSPDDPAPAVHECSERNARAGDAYVASIQKSLDCQGFYFHDPERKAVCEEINGRLDAIDAGRDPFTTTTTIRP